MNGQAPRDIIEYQFLADEAELELDVRRGRSRHHGRRRERRRRAPRASRSTRRCSTASARATTTASSASSTSCPRACDPSLYVKDDDYRLSFLYGNFTTLTRFTEADLERVIDERLSPLYVSIHATDPEVRARMLRNGRGATSLRWLRALLDNGIEVHGQVVVCPGVNDGAVLEDTLTGLLDVYPDLATAAVVPLGVSRYTTEPAMRTHSRAEAAAVVDLVEEAQRDFVAAVGRRVVFAADEYYLLAGRDRCRSRRLRRVPAARERHRDGAGLRGRVPRRRRADPGPQWLLRRARRRTGATATGPRARATLRPGARRLAGRDPHRRVRRTRGGPARRRIATTSRAAGEERVLRRQHRGHRAARGRRRRPGARRSARGPSLPPARRLSVPRHVHRRADARRTPALGRGGRHRRPIVARGARA